MTDPLPALRQAAAALLAEAPMPVVRGMLRALLADAEAAPAAAAEATPVSARPLQRPEPKPAAVRTKPAAAPAPKRTRPPPVPDPAWDERRVQIRTAMQERGISYVDLAAKFRVKVPTLKHVLYCRQAPGGTMKRRLDSWMKSSAPAPVVAEPVAPFRSNSAAAGHASAGYAGSAAAAD